MSKLFRYSLFLFILVGLPFMALPVLPNALALPTPAAISAVFTVAYLGILVAVVRRTRLWPYQGWAPALLAVLWGAGTSYALVSVSAPSIIDLAAHTGATTTAASWGGAYPEEIAKATGVVFILLAFRQLNRPWHGFVIGMLVGLGFESFENLLYGIVMSPIHPSSDIMGVLQIWGARVFLGPFLHIAFTGLAGWGIGWALFAVGRGLAWRLAHALGWFAVAFACHFGWNILGDNLVLLIGSKIVTGIVLYASFIYVWVAAFKAAKPQNELYTAVSQLPSNQPSNKQPAH